MARFLLYLLATDLALGFFTVPGSFAPPTIAYFLLFFTTDTMGKEFLMIKVLPYMVTSLAGAYILSNIL
ncbi:MAG: hypothetical protein CMP81_00035 [Fulvimarina sp.]|nr:hypothetical protein [Fulvimarina sp.]